MPAFRLGAVTAEAIVNGPRHRSAGSGRLISGRLSFAERSGPNSVCGDPRALLALFAALRVLAVAGVIRNGTGLATRGGRL